jgi:farnesyl diphosphate synthase
MNVTTQDPQLLHAWMRPVLASVESCLDGWIPSDAPAGLGLAMRYAVLDGGKRLRPLLVCAAAEAVSSSSTSQSLSPAVMRAACAVELIHAYSLVHDDLPCMDNDVLRRGKPTVHVQFGEAQALLAGDALQALAFELLLAIDDPQMALELSRQLATASGYAGMAGGQALDLAGVGQSLNQIQLEDMHRRKTGALLLASVTMGATAGQAGPEALRALRVYGQSLGLAFQVVDDVLDVVADSATLGKTAGKDAAADKPTFVSLMGLEGARAYADQLLLQAHQALEVAELPQPQTLHHLADWVVHRTH